MWDKDTYTITDDRHNDRLVVTRNDGKERLVFPYHWNGRRKFLYMSRDKPIATRENWTGSDWQGQKMDMATFTAWMRSLEQVP